MFLATQLQKELPIFCMMCFLVENGELKEIKFGSAVSRDF